MASFDEVKSVGSAILSICENRWMTPMDIFDYADHDKSNSLTFEEFDAALADFQIKVDTISVFTYIDIDGDLQISRQEFEAFFKRIGVAHQYESLMIPSNIARLDAHKKRTSQIAGMLDELGEQTGFVALIAHNRMKQYLVRFVEEHIRFFKSVQIVSTNSTGVVLERKLGLTVGVKVSSGPLGGDQQVGGMVAEGKISAVFFFKDPLLAHVHSADIEALARLCDVYQIPCAFNPSTGQAIILALASWGLNGWYGTPDDDCDSALTKYKEGQNIRIKETIGQQN